MSGPIVRTGTTPEFWKNWDQAFGKKKKETGKKKAAKPADSEAEKKVVNKSAGKASKKTK